MKIGRVILWIASFAPTVSGWIQGAVATFLLGFILPQTLRAEAVRLGDMDGDGVPTVVDLVYLANHISGESPLPDSIVAYADLNEDGVVDERDVTFLADAILGLRSLPNPHAPPIVLIPTDSTSETSIAISGSTRPYRTVVLTTGTSQVVVSASSNGTFNASVPLVPNSLNRVVVTATNQTFRLGSSRIVEIMQDREAPTLFIDSPVNDSSVITTNVTVLGRVGDFLSGSKGISVSVSNTTAGVGEVYGANVYVGTGNNGTFERSGVALAEGKNVLIVSASDIHGNTTNVECTVYRRAPRGHGLFAFSGDMQTTNIHRRLSKPIEVQIVDTNGLPMVGKLVDFRVSRSDGQLVASSRWPAQMTRRLQVPTDSNGTARAWWVIGGEAGCANNQVSVTSRSIDGTVLFCASGMAAQPVQVNVGSGNNQVMEVDSPAAEPLRVWVTDMCNGVPSASVQFSVKTGNGKVNGSSTAIVRTSRTGHAQVEFEAGPEAGQQSVEASIEGSARPPAVFAFQVMKRDPSQPTSFATTVFDSAYQPIRGVNVELEVAGHTFQKSSDELGRVEFVGVPEGLGKLQVNGDTASYVGTNAVLGSSFPSVPYQLLLLPNVANTLPAPILLPRLNPANAKTYFGTNDVELTCEGVAGVRLLVKAGSLRLADGSKPTGPVTVSIDQVHFNKMPMPPPDGASPTFMWNVQPAGATFDPPIQIDSPNVDALPPGSVVPIMGFSPRTERLEVVGTAQVSEDGAKISSDRGSGIRTGGNGGHCTYGFLSFLFKGPDPDPDRDGYSPKDSVGDLRKSLKPSSGLAPKDGQGSDNPNTHKGGDPVLLGSGEFVLTETDLSIPGRGFPFEMTRTYRSRFDYDGPLGHGWDFCHNQRLDLTGLSEFPPRLVWQNGYGRADIFTLGSSVDSFEGPAGSYVVIRRTTAGRFVARDRYGSRMTFREDGFLVRREDRFDNVMEFKRDDAGVLNQVIDTLGRRIVFSYYPNGRLSRVRDYTGREIVYRYDERGDLISVRSPLVIGTSTANDFLLGKITRYEYLSGFEGSKASLNHNLESIIDPQRQRFLRNVYGDNPNDYEFDRVIQQTAGAPNQVYTFRYRELNVGNDGADLNLPKNETIRIDRNGNRAVFVHGSGGNLLEQRIRTNRSINPNDPKEFLTRFTYNANGEQIEVVYPEGNSTTFGYDSDNRDKAQRGNLLSTTMLPGPRNADQTSRIITQKYEPIFNQVREVTDERGNSGSFVPPNGGVHSADRYTSRWVFDYQEGNDLSELVSRTGRSIEELTTLLNRAGIETNLGDLNGDRNTSQNVGNAVQWTQPSVRLLPDSEEARNEGRVLQPHVTKFTYNRFGQLVSRTDPEGNLDEYFYHPENDPDGDGRLTVTDRSLARDTGGYPAAVIIDSQSVPGRRSESPPARIRTETYYDPAGNLIRSVDGRGNDTLFEVNALNQVVTESSRAPFRFVRRLHYDANDNIVKEESQNVFANGPTFGAYATKSFTYDINNNRKTITEWPSHSESLVTRYDYDANDNSIRITQPEGNAIEQAFDERDLLYSITRGVGSALASTRRMTYDGNANLILSEDAEDKNGDGAPDATRREYDGYDRLRRIVDAAGYELSQTYDPVGNITKLHYRGPNGGSTPANNQGTENVLLSATEQKHDELNRRFQTDALLFANQTPVGPEGPLTPGDGRITTRFEYNRNSQLTRILDDNVHQSTVIYDGARRRVLERDQLGNQRRIAYDGNSNPTNITTLDVSPEGIVPAEAFVTTQEFDELDRPISITDNIGNTQGFSYDSHGNRIAQRDAMGNVTLWVFDGLGRKVADVQELRTTGTGSGPLATNIFNPDGRIVTSYKWDRNSRLSAVIDDRGNTTAYGYDPLNRKVLERFANQTTRVALYDRDNNLTFVRDQNGSTIFNRYDSLNRLVRVDVVRGPGVEGTTLRTYEYDGLSRRTRSTDNNDPSLSDDNSVVECRYDSLGHLLVETQNGVAVTTQFDGVGNRVAYTYPSQRIVDCDYDGLNRLRTIRDRGDPGFIAQYQYIGKSRVLERRSGNGTRLRFHDDNGHQVGYDAIRRTTRLINETSSGQQIASYGYAYDRSGNRRYEHDLIKNSADIYEYDSAYRLTRAQSAVPAAAISAIRNNDSENDDVAALAGSSETTYTLDGVGNWRTKSEDRVPTTFEPNEVNEYSNRETHDANGNLTQDDSNRYHYDFANRLIRATPIFGAGSATYSYDTLGRRRSKTLNGKITTFFYAGSRLIEERRNGNASLQFVYGRELDEVVQLKNSSGTFFYSRNSLGSVVALTDTAGFLTERYDYDEYGVTTVIGTNGETQSGSTVSNPYRYTGRWFDDETGNYDCRLRSYRPSAGRFLQRDPIGYLAGINLLSYTGNNPINHLDPFGLDREQPDPRSVDPLASFPEFESQHCGAMLGGCTQLNAGQNRGLLDEFRQWLYERYFWGTYSDPLQGSLFAVDTEAQKRLFESGALQQGDLDFWLLPFLGPSAKILFEGREGFVAKGTVGEILAGHSSDTMIHLTTATEQELATATFPHFTPPHTTPGVFQGSSWVKLGDVSHMTLAEYQELVVGPCAAGYGNEVIAFVTHPPTSVFSSVNVPNLGGVQEFINGAVVKPGAYVPLPGRP